MGDVFYKSVRFVGRFGFWCSSRPMIFVEPETAGTTAGTSAGKTARGDGVPLTGACLVAATHTSAYDVPLMMRQFSRHLDFVSITEVFKNPLVAWFYGNLNAFPLERARPDPKAVRVLMARLERGRCVAMFPEGRFCPGAKSVVYSGQIKRGIGRISVLSGAPIVPVVVVNSEAYKRFASWLPRFATRYGVAIGRPISPSEHAGNAEAIEAALVAAFVRLHVAISARLGRQMDPQLAGPAQAGPVQAGPVQAGPVRAQGHSKDEPGGTAAPPAA